MEHAFNKHTSHYKFEDCYKQPAKAGPCHRSAPKATSKSRNDKHYTQVSSSRLTNKVSASTHHSPGKPKHEKLLKTSVLNYLHKCRSEYEDVSTTTTHPKSTKHIRSTNAAEPDQRTVKRVLTQKVSEGEILERTAELLGMYRRRCEGL